MKIDFSALEAFYAFLDGRLPLVTVLDHPAYQTVARHTRRIGKTIGPDDVIMALEGRESPFYGLRNVRKNLNEIRQLEGIVRSHADEWSLLSEGAIHALLPEVDLSGITVYPILGYDMGIGLLHTVCMNLNVPKYLRQPHEFLYYLIHEAMHVVYEDYHTIPTQPVIDTLDHRLADFGLWVQSEGYAVYTPLHLRMQNDHMADEDYQVLIDPARLAQSIREFQSICQALREPGPMGLSEYLELIYGDHRVTYRVGCEIIRRIEEQCQLGTAPGKLSAREAFFLDGAAFLEQFSGCLG
jgi:hypothetical protein